MSYQQPYTQQPYNNAPPPKKINPLTIVAIIALPLLAIPIAFIATTQISNAERDKANSVPSYYATGGYAETEEEVDSHLQRRIDEEKELLQLLDKEYGIKAYHGSITTDEHYYGYKGYPEEDERTAVRFDPSYYLPGNADLKDVDKTVAEFLRSKGYILEGYEPGADYGNGYDIYRNDKVDGSKADNKSETLHVSIREPVQDIPYAWVEFWDSSTTTYPLSGVPTWSGFFDMDGTQMEEGMFLYAKDPGAYTDELCALEENSVVGFWDKNYECLSDQIWNETEK